MRSDILEQLFVKYYNDALLYSLSLSGSKAMAEELAAVAFYKAIDCAEDEIRDFKAWLLTVCRNSYFTYLKKQSKITKLNESIESDEESVLDKIIRDEEYRALYHAISLLQAEQKEVILLFYFEQMQIKSIAEITGKSTSYVKVLLYRARENLRKLLEA